MKRALYLAPLLIAVNSCGTTPDLDAVREAMGAISLDVLDPTVRRLWLRGATSASGACRQMVVGRWSWTLGTRMSDPVSR